MSFLTMAEKGEADSVLVNDRKDHNDTFTVASKTTLGTTYDGKIHVSILGLAEKKARKFLIGALRTALQHQPSRGLLHNV
eukprot:CCRYP_006905-RC/>CCRYP_006905-RC protein AED:0.42 eAED:0.42 QI:0/0.5/0.33/1/0/0/3/651/79